MIIWQDIVITICQLLFMASLIPMLLGPHKPPKITCITTFILILVLLFCFITLKWIFVSILTIVESVAWLVLSIQTWKQKKEENK